jgi:glycosyltransferase involved in cell wall biosynthesis
VSAPIRVCHVIEATTGGTRRHVADLVTHLERERFDVSLLCATRRDPGFRNDIKRMREAGVTVHEVDMRRSIDPLHDMAAYRALHEHFSRAKFDVVHTHSSKAGALGRMAAAKAGIGAAVHTPHVFPFQMEQPAIARTMYTAIERRLSRQCRAIICVSRAEQDTARALDLCPVEKLRYIPNGIQVAAEPADVPAALRDGLGIASDRKLIGMVGRISRQKGTDLLVEAAPAIRAAHADAEFVIVGDGPGMPALRQQIETANLVSVFHLVGPREDAERFYPLFDVLALPSRWEGLPYTLLESMAAGLPVVASSVGGNAEVLADNENGLLVPPGSPERLSEAVGRVLDDSQLAETLGRAARERVRSEYSLDAMMRKTTELYEELLASNEPLRP